MSEAASYWWFPLLIRKDVTFQNIPMRRKIFILVTPVMDNKLSGIPDVLTEHAPQKKSDVKEKMRYLRG